jgi:hypothetical protein
VDVDSTSNDNLNDNAMDWERISMSLNAREVRARLCGRYASLETGTIDEVRFLFCFLFT